MLLTYYWWCLCVVTFTKVLEMTDKIAEKGKKYAKSVYMYYTVVYKTRTHGCIWNCNLFALCYTNKYKRYGFAFANLFVRLLNKNDLLLSLIWPKLVILNNIEYIRFLLYFTYLFVEMEICDWWLRGGCGSQFITITTTTSCGPAKRVFVAPG